MNSALSKTDQYWDRVITCIFFTAISLPLLFFAFSGRSRVSLTENRTLAACPQVPRSIHGVASFPRAFENYFNDHFGLRDQFVSLGNRLTRLLNDSPSENVVQGKQGWLFLKGESNFSPLRDAQNLDLFTEFELKAYSASIVKKYRWLKARGIAYLYVVAPDKHTIYSDMLPPYIKKQNPEPVLTQLMDYVKKNTQVPVLDLRHALLARRPSSPFASYGRFDTHWNAYGANIAQYEILKKVDRLLPGRIVPHLYGDHEFRLVDSRSGDLAKMMGRVETHQVPQLIRPPIPYTVFGTIGPSPHVIACDSGKLSALIFRDSFCGQLQPYLTPYFRRAKYITLYRPTIFDIQRELKTEHPDIVIEELAERFLPARLNPFERIGAALAKKEILTGETIYEMTPRESALIETNELELTPVPGKRSAFRLVSTGNDPDLVLTGLRFKSGKKYLLDLNIRSNHKSYLQFFWTSGHNTGEFTEAQSIRQPIENGENRLTFLLGHTRLDPSLRIDFGEQPGEFTLSRLKIVALGP